MIYTYSPNWYKPQCLHFSKDHLYYSSNYLIYRYSLEQRRVQSEICLRQIALDYKLNHRDIKVNAITSNSKEIFIGINQSYLIIIEKENKNVIAVVKLEDFQSVQYIYLFGELKNKVLVWNKEGKMMKYDPDELKEPFPIEIKHKLSQVKSVLPIGKHNVAVFTRGTVLIYNQQFTKLEKTVQLDVGQAILSVDMFKKQNLNIVAFLTRSKESFYIRTFEFVYKEEFPLEFKKKLEEIGDNISKFSVNIHYPKKYIQKLKSNPKASLSIKIISSGQIILTGKLGQIFTLFIDFINKDEAITIKPYSMQQEQKKYEVWNDSKHYKEIYGIYEHSSQLHFISTDHNMSVWSLSNKGPKYAYSIKFLTSGVQSFFYSESDPRNMFALLKDSFIRSFSPLDEGSHYLNQFWKFTKKYKIKKAILHPSQQGVLALVTECKKIQIYDAFEDRLMKIIQIGTDILNITFEHPSIVKEIQCLFKNEVVNEKLQYLSQFQKQIQNDTILLIQTKQMLIFVSDLAFKEPKFHKIKKERRLERIHENNLWNQKLLLSTQSKQGVLNLKIRFQGNQIERNVELAYPQGRFFFKAPHKTSILYIMNFKGSKISIFCLQIRKQEKSIQIMKVKEYNLPYPIDVISISYEQQKLCLYNQKDDVVQFIYFGNLLKEQQECLKILELKTKIETISFYLQDYIIVATKDQSIKIIKYKDGWQDLDHKKKKKVKNEIKEEVKPEEQENKKQQK